MQRKISVLQYERHNVPLAKASHVIKDREHLGTLGEVDRTVGKSVGISNVYKREIL